MILTIDIGNTHTDVGVGDERRVMRAKKFRSDGWTDEEQKRRFLAFVRRRRLRVVTVASVVPLVTPVIEAMIRECFGMDCVCLTHRNVVGIGIDYPKPQTIGTDRLANAMAATALFPVPVVVVDFGTAVTFDVVDRRGAYVGGIIAPGLGAMTDYLHEKTALLPLVTIRDPKRTIGKSTREAMLVGAVKGYRGLITSLLSELKGELGVRRLNVVATGGCAELVARDLPLVRDVLPLLTLEGLRILAVDCLNLSQKS